MPVLYRRVDCSQKSSLRVRVACPALQVSQCYPHHTLPGIPILLADLNLHAYRSPSFKIAPVLSALKEVALQQHRTEFAVLRQECEQEEQEEREREAEIAAAAAQTGPFEPLLAPLLQKIYALLPWYLPSRRSRCNRSTGQECRQVEQEEREREAVIAAAAAQTGPFEPLLEPLLQKIYALL